MSLADFQAFLATPGQKTDAQIVAAMAASRVSDADVARLINVPVDQVSQRANAAREQEFRNFISQPGVTQATAFSEMNRLGLNNQQVADIGGLPLAEIERRVAALQQPPTVVRPPVVVQPPTPVVQPPVLTREQEFKNFIGQPGVTQAQAFAEMSRLGLTNQQVADIGGLPLTEVENRINALTFDLPFANANQGFTQQFKNYTSIPIGAQYNPNVVGGVGSPYSQIMNQMQPVGNPYATARAGLVMGGYDPNIYARNVQADKDAAAAAAAAAAIAGNTIQSGNAGGASAGDAAAAPGGVGGNGVSGSGTGVSGIGSNYAMGGLIDSVSGQDPAGPDDGQINAQKGEYVIKKSSVKKYGQGLLDMINEGKMPAKKMKSLLG